MPGMRDLSVAVGKWVRRSHTCTLMCFVTPLVDSVSEIFQRLSSMAWRWSNPATRMTHESRAVARGGRRSSSCLEVIQRDEQKVFPFPCHLASFSMYGGLRGGASWNWACWSVTRVLPMVADAPRMGPRGGGWGTGGSKAVGACGGALGGDGASLGTRHHPSTFLPPTMLYTEAACSGWLPTVMGKAVGVVNLSLYPFFPMKMLWVTVKRRVLLKMPLYTCRFFPLVCQAVGGCWPLIAPNKQTFQQRMQGGYHGRGYLIPERKRCRDVSDRSVFGCWAQKYAAARLSAVAEYSGAV